MEHCFVGFVIFRDIWIIVQEWGYPTECMCCSPLNYSKKQGTEGQRPRSGYKINKCRACDPLYKSELYKRNRMSTIMVK